MEDSSMQNADGSGAPPPEKKCGLPGCQFYFEDHPKYCCRSHAAAAHIRVPLKDPSKCCLPDA
eukprot:scaffold144572_cov43-Prasinocladus_malaysianus.AAC.1